MDFEKIVMSRHAARKFDGKKIDEAKVEKLLELIRYAPSSYNIQPWAIKIISDQTIKDKLAPAAWNQPQITTCSHLLVFCANTDIVSHIDMLENQLKQANLPTEVVGMMRNFEKGMNPDQKRSWAQRQVYLALGNALNGAKELGFDSCPMEGFDPKAFAEILNLPQNIIPTALCTIGYTSDTVRAKMRLDKKDILI